jgi:hypothetical protein
VTHRTLTRIFHGAARGIVVLCAGIAIRAVVLLDHMHQRGPWVLCDNVGFRHHIRRMPTTGRSNRPLLVAIAHLNQRDPADLANVLIAAADVQERHLAVDAVLHVETNYPTVAVDTADGPNIFGNLPAQRTAQETRNILRKACERVCATITKEHSRRGRT